MPDVVVVGAGPVGMLLAGELHRRGVDVEVYERRPQAGGGSRAIGIHAAVLGALEESGLTDRLLAHAQRVPRGEARVDGVPVGVVRFDRLPMRFPFVATLPQERTEAVLAVDAPEPLRGAEVLALNSGGERVRVRAGVAGHLTELDAPIVVVASGAGGRGLVYRSGAHTYRDRYLMADVAAAPRPDAEVAVVNLDRSGVLESFPLPGGARRFVAWDDHRADPSPDARTDRFRNALRARGEEVAASAVTAATGFGVRRFTAPQMRRGRVFVIGDAAHEVSPIGGQGMNLGLLDAVTLAPLLSDWIRRGEAPEGELRRWESRRVRSARTAASLATLNTSLGRPLSGAAHAARRAAVTAMLAGAAGSLFARAYAMGFDRDA
ncbi:MAG: NAD(P)/FAD-dependent oxidoreductase [Microbacterium sp.]